MNRSGRILLGTLTVCVAAALIVSRCSPDQTSGGGTEGGNVVSGVIINDNGRVSAKMNVLLIPSDYNPGAVDHNHPVVTSVTANDGGYSFDHVPQGTYSIEAMDTASGKRSLITGVAVSGEDIRIPDDTLQVPGVILVFLPADAGAGAAAGYVYVPGTTICARFNGSAGYAVVNAPSSTPLPPICYTTLSDPTAVVLRYDVQVVPSDTTVVTNTEWKYARRLCLNTTATGADVTRNVVEFPVVVRLTEDNFNFTRANPDGSDIRFFRSDTIGLPYEIERWDPVTELAEVWVKVDTIYGNDSTQFISMYWGNAAADDGSNGAAVFDTANGFQGVWHLGDAAEDPVHDATDNRYHGISPDTARPSLTEGVAGNCRVFNGVTDYITMPNTADGKMNFPGDGYYTVSAWVFLDTIDTEERVIIAKGGTQYFLMLTYVPSGLPLWDFAEFSETDSWQACTAAATDRQWTLLTGVSEGGKQLLYCNGALVNSTPAIYPTGSYSRNTSNDLTIGRFLKMVSSTTTSGSYCFFKGSIDEVRIIGTAKSPDWVRLCYMNERPDDRLVVFK
jgi:hypothetical protein